MAQVLARRSADQGPPAPPKLTTFSDGTQPLGPVAPEGVAARDGAGIAGGYLYSCRRKGRGFKEQQVTAGVTCPRCSMKVWLSPVCSPPQCSPIASTSLGQWAETVTLAAGATEMPERLLSPVRQSASHSLNRWDHESSYVLVHPQWGAALRPEPEHAHPPLARSLGKLTGRTEALHPIRGELLRRCRRPCRPRLSQYWKTSVATGSFRS